MSNLHNKVLFCLGDNQEIVREATEAGHQGDDRRRVGGKYLDRPHASDYMSAEEQARSRRAGPVERREPSTAVGVP